MNAPLLSIITPAFNGVRFIEQCIELVAAENCPEVEHVIVDGGSSDGTAEKIKAAAARFSHLRWLSEPDNGQSEAMNKGIKLARAEVIGFLNIDDFYVPGTLRRILSLIPSLPKPALLVGNCMVLGEDEKPLFYNQPRNLKLQALLMGRRLHPYPVNPSQYFYHRQLHDLVGTYRTDCHYEMDAEFIFRAVQKANLVYLNEHWGNFRLIAGTKTFEDNAQGLGADRLKHWYHHYRKDIGLFSRIKAALSYPLFHEQNLVGDWLLEHRSISAAAKSIFFPQIKYLLHTALKRHSAQDTEEIRDIT